MILNDDKFQLNKNILFFFFFSFIRFCFSTQSNVKACAATRCCRSLAVKRLPVWFEPLSAKSACCPRVGSAGTWTVFLWMWARGMQATVGLPLFVTLWWTGNRVQHRPHLALAGIGFSNLVTASAGGRLIEDEFLKKWHDKLKGNVCLTVDLTPFWWLEVVALQSTVKMDSCIFHFQRFILQWRPVRDLSVVKGDSNRFVCRQKGNWL